MANSWNTKLGEEIGACLGEEAASQDVGVVLGPGLNIKRNPLCGRNFEYLSEDPYLAGKMAAAYIRGIQSRGVAACPKHFAANSQELRRMASDSIMDERTLREIYLTGFEIAVKEAKPKSIMAAYNRVNGVYANESGHLLQEILRDEWGFNGFVVSDWGGSNDHPAGVEAGAHLEMPSTGGDSDEELIKAVKEGTISEEILNQRVGELAKMAEIVLMYIGLDEISESEGLDRKHMRIPDIRLTGTIAVRGTDAPISEEKAALPSYFSGNIQDISDEEFAALLGHEIPDGHWTGQLDRNDAICQMYYAKGRVARLVYRILTGMLKKSIEKGKPDLNIMFIYNMPFRGIGKMAGGMCSQYMVDGIVKAVNGIFLPDWGRLLPGFSDRRRY